MSFDKNKPYGEIYGDKFDRVYEQGGKHYDVNEREVHVRQARDKNGDPLFKVEGDREIEVLERFFPEREAAEAAAKAGADAKFEAEAAEAVKAAEAAKQPNGKQQSTQKQEPAGSDQVAQQLAG